jgi:UDP-galactopyranose mutase
MNPPDVRGAIETADLLVVGAGFFGLTVARCASEALGARVVVVERRDHIGGNAHSFVDSDTGIEVHRYGSHLFHTSNQEVWDFARRFTDFNDYRHHVYTVHRGRVFSMPINMNTLCAYFERSLTPTEARELVEAATRGRDPATAASLEDRAIALIGEDLYRAFVAGYTQKQWQVDPQDLPAEIINRLPVRYTFDSRYFSDTWEGLPLDGYHAWFAHLVDHPDIRIFTGVDYFDVRPELTRTPPMVFTGPLDRYFDHRAGPLSWRTLDFEIETLEVPDFQGTSVMNYADLDVPFTRIHELRHLHPERAGVAEDRTIVMREYSRAALTTDEPYYPIRTDEDRRRLNAYRELARSEPRVVFGGRLGTYAYLDMHMAMASALQTYRNQVVPMLAAERP